MKKLIILCGIWLSLLSCSKDEINTTNDDKSIKLIKTIAYSTNHPADDNYIMNLEYDANKRITRKITDNQKTADEEVLYSYANNKISVTCPKGNCTSYDYVGVHTLNSDGLSISWLDGLDEINFKFDNNGYLINNDYQNSYDTSFTISNGNIITETFENGGGSSKSTITYEFTNDVSNFNLDITGQRSEDIDRSFINFLGKSNKNLVKKSTSNSGTVSDYSYVFDGKGQITIMTIKTGNIIEDYRLTYID